jgi:hypothetical protein
MIVDRVPHLLVLFTNRAVNIIILCMIIFNKVEQLKLTT